MLSRRRGLAGLLALAAAPSVARGEGALRFQHAYGETRLSRPARRVVSLGYTAHDALYALGVEPLATRYWYGSHAHGIWPWTAALAEDSTPTMIRGEVSAEVVAELRPDLIIGLGSGISPVEYALLSRIAPVLMHEPGVGPYETPWRAGLRAVARALGLEPRAERLIQGVDAQLGAIRSRHPGWQGKTAVAAYHFGGQTGVFTAIDSRSQFLQELGFVVPDKIRRMRSVDGFFAQLSPEDLSPIEADVVIWISTWDDNPELAALPMRKTLTAHQQGREVFSGHVLSGALSFNSVLSIPYAAAQLEGLIEAAIDGVLQTTVSTSLRAGLVPAGQP